MGEVLIKASVLCDDIVRKKYDVPALVHHFLVWNQSLQYKTKSFKYVILNVELLSSLQDVSFEETLINVLKNEMSYADIEKWIKNSDERVQFQKYSSIIPFRKRGRHSSHLR
ncbi:hypothetical protein [Bacillus alkalicellulosilyticus]|uniref:hypothetical protein n=1 Tax=Alkalihalobacterium alkalicellulosilyticum TaxID=1912214 RepID=UPI000996964B|nr:hypothetical protein [Bacillus alkalicellulosilyticus]